ncbi:cysteine desulfurase [Hydrogenibacillus sp. N12]|uniref:cysteine desulfurase n=1 Tax=Hydrogenibacillus sp. N12 TaxID=2866627 RepID=UPI001C7CE9C7|nr:cysteine desulfurase [Hydrogenibacillus sp. N12]QZA32732.1 cysteine desulfurase [Hydrogenibacillus sp. N12]
MTDRTARRPLVPKALRADFPIFDQTIAGRPLVYLDSAATAQKPRAVLEAMTRFYERDYANVHRAVHTLAGRATEAYEAAREAVRRFLGARSAAEIVFTRSTTGSLNLVAQAYARPRLGPGDEIVLTPLEHHANLLPWQRVARETGARLVFIEPTDDLRITEAAIDQAISPRTKIVALAHVSNVTGAVAPIAYAARRAHAVGAVIVVDAAQSAPHLPLDVRALDVDFLAFSGHKMLGPTGIGVLYAKEEHLRSMEPYEVGGEMIDRVTLFDATWREPPWKFEAGTPPIAEAIGLRAAIEYLEAIGMDAIEAHVVRLTNLAAEALANEPGVVVYGPRTDRHAVVAFNVGRIHAHDVSTVLDAEGIAVRAGHHCAQPLMTRLCVPATVRASFYLYNDEDDVERLVVGVRRVKEFFGDVFGEPVPGDHPGSL